MHFPVQNEQNFDWDDAVTENLPQELSFGHKLRCLMIQIYNVNSFMAYIKFLYK